MLSAKELESYLYRHPSIWDVAVLNHSEEKLLVCVEPKPGHNIDCSELALFCQPVSGDTPKEFFVVSKLPKTNTGKLYRLGLADMCTAKASSL